MTTERIAMVGLLWILAAIVFGLAGAGSLVAVPLGVGLGLLFVAAQEGAILRAHRIR